MTDLAVGRASPLEAVILVAAPPRCGTAEAVMTDAAKLTAGGWARRSADDDGCIGEEVIGWGGNF